MVKIRTPFRSEIAPAILVALTQAPPDGLTLRELARAVDRPDSTVQRALPALLADGYVRAGGRGGTRRYARDPAHPVADEMLRVAMHSLSPLDLTRALVRANEAVEFAAIDDDQLVIVYKDGADPRARLRLERTLRARPGTRPELNAMSHDEAAERLRSKIRSWTPGKNAILKGSVARTIPDRTRHGDFLSARRLGRPHASLPRLSRRTLQRLARDHGLSRLALFGSAVRSDFRPDSDVDVLVGRRAGREPSLTDEARLQRALEELLDRDVDVVDEDRLEASFRPLVERDRVVLYGRP